MPIFEYECQGCGHIVEALQKAGEGALRKCPECGALKLRKLLSAPAFQVKGAAAAATTTRTRVGHTFDSPHAHSHGHGHSHSHGNSHGHSHGGGCGGGKCGSA